MAVEQANTNSCCQVVYRDITENPLRTTRQLETLPTMLIVNQDGEELSRRVGFKSEDQLVDWIRFTASPNGF